MQVTITGSTGSGKTTLIHCLKQQGYTTKFITIAAASNKRTTEIWEVTKPKTSKPTGE